MNFTKRHVFGALGVGIAGGGFFGLVFGLVVGAVIGGSSSGGYSSYDYYDDYGSGPTQVYQTDPGYGQGYYGTTDQFYTNDGGWHTNHTSGTIDRNDYRNSVISVGGEVLNIP